MKLADLVKMTLTLAICAGVGAGIALGVASAVLVIWAHG